MAGEEMGPDQASDASVEASQAPSDEDPDQPTPSQNTFRLRYYQKKSESLEQLVRVLRQDNSDLRRENTKLNAKLEALLRPRKTVATWPDDLARYIAAGAPAGAYKEVLKKANKEGNMSTDPARVHHAITLVPPSENQDLSQPPKGGAVTFNTGPASIPTPASSALFDKMMDEPKIAGLIFNFVFHVPEGPIHVFSRLDPHVPPSTPITSFPRRFYWGQQDVNLTYDTKDPKVVLGPLLVCKRWLWLGVHFFFGTNRFAFSSLGELGRFCRGIGPARLARIQSVEFSWQGHQYLTFAKEGKNEKKFKSRRTQPLRYLLEMPLLVSIIVFMIESGPNYKRRGHEPSEAQESLKYWTAGQKNRRLNRAMRTVQGMDYVYALRGLRQIRFFDSWNVIRAKRNTHEPGTTWPVIEIMDTSFLSDIRASVLKRKVKTQAEAAKLKNLYPLLPLTLPPRPEQLAAAAAQSFTPSDVDWETAESALDSFKKKLSDPYPQGPVVDHEEEEEVGVDDGEARDEPDDDDCADGRESDGEDNDDRNDNGRDGSAETDNHSVVFESIIIDDTDENSEDDDLRSEDGAREEPGNASAAVTPDGRGTNLGANSQDSRTGNAGEKDGGVAAGVPTIPVPSHGLPSPPSDTRTHGDHGAIVSRRSLSPTPGLASSPRAQWSSHTPCVGNRDESESMFVTPNPQGPSTTPGPAWPGWRRGPSVEEHVNWWQPHTPVPSGAGASMAPPPPPTGRAPEVAPVFDLTNDSLDGAVDARPGGIGTKRAAAYNADTDVQNLVLDVVHPGMEESPHAIDADVQNPTIAAVHPDIEESGYQSDTDVQNSAHDTDTYVQRLAHDKPGAEILAEEATTMLEDIKLSRKRNLDDVEGNDLSGEHVKRAKTSGYE